MARMSIDDKVCRDPRITVLAEILGWSRRETVGCLVLDVWPICYDQECHLLSERSIDAAAKHVGFAKAMIEAELATLDRSGKLRVNGAKERIKYLNHKRRAGREGGIKSAYSRTKHIKQTSSTRGSTPQAAGNPSVPDLPSASASPPVPVPPPVLPERLAPHTPALRAFDAYFKATNNGASPTWDATKVSMLKTLVSKHTCAEVERRIANLSSAPPSFPAGPWDLGTFVQHFDKCAKPHAAKPANRSQSAFDLQMERVRQLEDEEKEGAA